MKNKEKAPKLMRLGQYSVAPGERKIIHLPMPELYNTSPLHLPVHIVRGKKSGPTLCLIAALHGDELNGIEVIRRVLKSSKLKHLTGTLIAIPVANVYGFLYQKRYLMDRRDLNRSFPGSAKGSLAARLAHLISNEIITHATHIIDLHTGSLHRANLAQIRANIDDKTTRSLAIAFNAPVILYSKEREGSLRKAVSNMAIPSLLYESGEALRFDESAIRTGASGIFNVMAKLKMIVGKKNNKDSKPIITYSSIWVRAKQSGMFKPRKPLGKQVKEGDVLGVIANPMALDEHPILAPISGVIIGRNNLPLIHEGAALFHIACVKDLNNEQKASLNMSDNGDINKHDPQLIM